MLEKWRRIDLYIADVNRLGAHEIQFISDHGECFHYFLNLFEAYLWGVIRAKMLYLSAFGEALLSIHINVSFPEDTWDEVVKPVLKITFSFVLFAGKTKVDLFKYTANIYRIDKKSRKLDLIVRKKAYPREAQSIVGMDMDCLASWLAEEIGARMLIRDGHLLISQSKNTNIS